MPELFVEIQSQWTNDLADLRRAGFPGDSSSTPLHDAFDTSADHIVARADGQPVGTVRLNRYPISPLHAWAVSPLPFPWDDTTAIVSRASVDIQWRGTGVYKLIMAVAILHASFHEHLKELIGAIELDFEGWSFLQRLGFRDLRVHADFVDPPVMRGRRCRCIALKLSRPANSVQHELRQVMASLAKRAISVELPKNLPV